MSVRAYKRTTEPKVARDPSFNLSRNWEVVDLFDYQALSDGGSGVIEANIGELKKALKEDKRIDKEIKKAILKDMEHLPDDDYITYECS